jgi:hypothetical protein
MESPAKMSTLCRLLALAALLALRPARAGAEDSIRCGGGLVSLGDSKLDLLGKCGAPTLVEVTEETPARQAGRALVAAERWTYNFGPSQFVMVVTLRAGRVAFVERGARGYDLAPPPPPRPIPRARCDANAIREGDLTFDLLARCGEPASRDARFERRAVGPAGGRRLFSDVTVEVWTYDFGPSALLRFVELVDGKVVAVSTGGHGYSD